MLIYPYANMMDTTMLTNITEWAPTNLNNSSHYIYIFFVVYIFFVLLFSSKKIRFIDLLLFGVSLFLCFKSIRFWAYTYIIMSYVIFNYVDERDLDYGTNIILLFLSAVFIITVVFSINKIDKQITNYQLSDEVIKSIKKEKPNRLFNMYDYGGELIYHDIKVFIDGRADLYSKYNYNDYLSISNLNGDYTLLIKKYDFDYFLISKKFPIYNYTKSNLDFVPVYENTDLVLYKKIVN